MLGIKLKKCKGFIKSSTYMEISHFTYFKTSINTHGAHQGGQWKKQHLLPNQNLRQNDHFLWFRIYQFPVWKNWLGLKIFKWAPLWQIEVCSWSLGIVSVMPSNGATLARSKVKQTNLLQSRCYQFWWLCKCLVFFNIKKLAISHCAVKWQPIHGSEVAIIARTIFIWMLNAAMGDWH